MATTNPLSRVELAAKYSDETWRAGFLDLPCFVEMLGSCIIDSKYKVSDELNRAIVLSEAGRRVRAQLITKEEVETKDANLLCLIGLVHVEPLVDVDAIDVDRLMDAVSAAVVSNRMKYPMIFGRALYDRAAEFFKEERTYLRGEDSHNWNASTPVSQT